MKPEDWKPFRERVEQGNFVGRQNTFSAIIRLRMPKWRGSHEAIGAFANGAVELTRETEGMGMYSRVYWYASQGDYGSELFEESKVDWARMRLAIADVLARYPDQSNINNFARFACLAGDAEETRSLLSRIEGGWQCRNGTAPPIRGWVEDGVR